MIEKIKNIFNNKEKRIENLIVFLIILIMTLIIINKILNDEKTQVDYENKIDVELASDNNFEVKDELEAKLENILSKISGVGKVSVLITYSESKTVVPIYNVNSSKTSTEEENKKTETLNEEKQVITDSSSNIMTEKIIMPQVEGAIIIAQGASDINVKSNIVSAIEAVTGISTYKIQVYEMGDD